MTLDAWGNSRTNTLQSQALKSSNNGMVWYRIKYKYFNVFKEKMLKIIRRMPNYKLSELARFEKEPNRISTY